MFLLLASNLCFAEPEPSATIVVEAHRDREVYVAPTVITNNSNSIEASVTKNSVFGYASSHSHNVQIKNKRGTYEPLLLNNEAFKIYNEETIEYVWDNCDYKKDAKKCSYKNSHYLLESYITISDEQIIVELFLYDSDLQIISRGTTTSTKVTNWIKQQEVKQESSQSSSPINPCIGSSCPIVNPNIPNNQTTVTKPKEELPIKWEVPPRLLNKHIHQASLLLWCSTKLKE